MDFSVHSSRSRQCRLVLACLMLGFAVSWTFLAPGSTLRAQQGDLAAIMAALLSAWAKRRRCRALFNAR